MLCVQVVVDTQLRAALMSALLWKKVLDIYRLIPALLEINAN